MRPLAHAVAFSSSSSPPSIPCFQLQRKLLKNQQYLLHYQFSLFSKVYNRRFVVNCSSNAPDKKTVLHVLKPHVDNFSERLRETFPKSAKEFPWKKAEEMMLKRLQFLGKRALKWCLLALLVISSLSDVVLSIIRNRELLIPVGVFLGCMMADFLKETSQELFESTEAKDVLEHIVGIGSIFVLLKVISLYMPIERRLFFSHICNGGLIQVFWLGKKLKEEKESTNEESVPQLAD